MVFIKLLFSSTMSKTSWLDRCSVQLTFINLLQIHISNGSSLWMSASLHVMFLRHTISYSKSESLLFSSLTLTSSFLSVILLVYWMLHFQWLFDVSLPHDIYSLLWSHFLKYTNCRTCSTLCPFIVIFIFFPPVLHTLLTFVFLMLIFIP